jgi:hypothetical protein
MGRRARIYPRLAPSGAIGPFENDASKAFAALYLAYRARVKL